MSRKPIGDRPLSAAERSEQRRARLANRGMTPRTLPLPDALWSEWERRAGELPGSMSRVERMVAVVTEAFELTRGNSIQNVAARNEPTSPAPEPPPASAGGESAVADTLPAVPATERPGRMSDADDALAAELQSNGFTFQEIADKLAAAGRTGANGVPFHRETVRRGVERAKKRRGGR